MLNRRHLLGTLATMAALIGTTRPHISAAQEPPGQRLEALGITLPPVATPVADYLPWVSDGSTVYIAGQLPSLAGEIQYPGRLGAELTLQQGQQAAEIAATNVLAALNAACEGDLSRVTRCLQLQGFVASADDFSAQSQVMDAASALMVAVLGEAGRHARVAVGVNVLPRHAAIEINAVFSVRGS